MRILVHRLLVALFVAGLAVPIPVSVAAAASYASPLVRGQERIKSPRCKFWKTVKIDGRVERQCVSWGHF